MDLNIKVSVSSYYFVVDDVIKNDVSIFTFDEWRDFMEMSKLISVNKDYIEKHRVASKKYREASYYLQANGFKDGFHQHGEIMSGLDFYIRIYNKGIETPVTINLFRKWMCEHHDELYEKYTYLIEKSILESI